MNVLVDTSVWSLAFRRSRVQAPEAAVLAQLIRQGRAVMLGPIRQELLSGFSRADQSEALKRHLRAFEDLPLETRHFEQAADCHNRCRTAGIQGSQTDFLICAVSLLEKLPVFTTDKDFIRYAKHLPLKLFEASRT